MGKSKSSVLAVPGGQGVPGFQAALKPSKSPAPQPKPDHMLVQHAAQGMPSEYARMLADPLNASPVGRPDSNSMATNVARFRDVYDVTSVGTIVAAAVVAHTAGGYRVPTLTGTAVNMAAGTAPTSQYHAQLDSDNNGSRTLCYVVEWQPTQSANAMSGRVYIGQYPVSTYDGLPSGEIATYFDDEGLTCPANVPAITIVRPWMDNDFLPVGGAQANVPSVVFVATGLPTSTIVGQLIITRIVELLPKGTVLARMQASHTVCDPMACCQGANIVGRKVTYAYGPNAAKDIVTQGLKLLSVVARVFKAVSSSGVSELLRAVA